MMRWVSIWLWRGLGCSIPGDPPGKLVRKRCVRLYGLEKEEEEGEEGNGWCEPGVRQMGEQKK